MPANKLGTTVTAWVKLKQKIKKMNAELADLTTQAEELVKPIIKYQEAENLVRTDVAIGSATLNIETLFSVTDWKEVWKYIFRHKDTAILSHQRLANALLRELAEEGIKIPGTKKYIKKSLKVGYKKGV